MRTSTAYFAGVGTVFVAVAAGLGGGYLAANVVSPPTQAVSKLERSVAEKKAVAEPIPVTKAAAEPVPYVAAKEMTPPPAAPATEQAQPQPPAQIEAAAPPPASAPRTEERTATSAAADASAPPAAATPKPAESKPVEKAEPKTTASRDSYARANDNDARRAAPERRRAERRPPAVERRQMQPREELDLVEERVREVTEPRRIRVREEVESRQFAEPTRSAAPRIRLFDLDE